MMQATLENPRLIQSYVLNNYVVSTIFRESSACTQSPLCYFETIVWTWNPATRERGEMLCCEDSGLSAKTALKNHFELIENLITTGTWERDEEEE
jgi:hypothetical protein